jgi:hypothetical protein
MWICPLNTDCSLKIPRTFPECFPNVPETPNVPLTFTDCSQNIPRLVPYVCPERFPNVHVRTLIMTLRWAVWCFRDFRFFSRVFMPASGEPQKRESDRQVRQRHFLGPPPRPLGNFTSGRDRSRRSRRSRRGGEWSIVDPTVGCTAGSPASEWI